MRLVLLSAVALAALFMLPASGHTQRLGSEPTDRTGRLDAGVTRVPESPRSDLRHHEHDFTPESHVPPRSPDLGIPHSPLSPSIGPGSGLLGPEAGRGPARLRSGSERDSRGLAGDPAER
jgi:hypothetical protein